MGQRLIVILILLLMVRPIALAKNFTCGDEAIATSTLNQDVPCSDIVQTSEIVESSHHCPCFALMQPELAGIMTKIESFTLFAWDGRTAETAVSLPPTPPPRLV